MDVVVATEALAKLLAGVSQPVEIRNESGRTLGVFAPAVITAGNTDSSGARFTATVDRSFPPLLEVGVRVWTAAGYHNHGPMDGPKVNIEPEMGGMIVDEVSRYPTGDDPLWTVRWDNGQLSKHYSKELFCIGRFRTLDDLEAAIQVNGPVEVTRGPMGGFRHVSLELVYDGHPQKAMIYDEDLWLTVVEPVATRAGAEITTVKLPRKTRQS